MTKKSILQNIFSGLIVVCLMTGAAFGQTTTFTYQGKLTDTGTPQAIYQMEFRLFGSPGGNDQIGSPISNNNVAVNQGVFTVNLDFDLGAAAFPGADRFLQISVRRSANESFVTLNPRQQIASSPYSIRTLSAAQADVALDANRLGGVDASEYVTTTSVGNTFIRNSTTQQTADFNVSGNGTLGGTLQASEVKAQTATGNYGLSHTGGTISLSSYVGGSASGVSGAWFGSVSNHPLHFFTNNGQPRMTIDMTGNVGIGTESPSAGHKLDVNGNTLIRNSGLGGNVQFGTPSGESGMTITGANRADIRFDGTTLKLLAGTGPGAMASTNGININRFGNVGLGTVTPNTRLTLSGGTPWTSAGWTASMNLQNASAIGWEANASGQRFGIGQSTGALYFFRTNSAFGNTDSPANYDMGITDTGNIVQARDKGGLVKAMIFVNADSSIIRCYNGMTNSSTGNCGFVVSNRIVGNGTGYRITFDFQVNDRFVSVTPQEAFGTSIGATFSFVNSTIIDVRTFSTDVDYQTSNSLNPFMIIIY